MVALARAGRTPQELSRELEPSAQTNRNWAAQAAVNDGDRDGLTSAKRKELRMLRHENNRLTFKNTANEKSAFDNSTVLSKVHASYRAIGKSLKTSMGGNLIGMVLITSDITVLLEKSGGAIDEINIPPGFITMIL